MSPTKLGTILLALGLAGLALMLLAQRDKARRLASDRERYRLFSTLANAHLFEYDYATRRLLFISGGPGGRDILTIREARALCHPEDRAQFEALYRNPPAQGEHAVLECRLCNPGEPFGWHECRAMTLFDKLGRPLRLMVRLENIAGRKEREEALLARSTLDDLTGLLNKRAAAMRVEEYLSSPCAQSGGALMMLDLDDFKSINDTRGHATGDLALLLTAQVLRESFREGDVLARAGGDEFLVFLPGICDRQAVWRKACQICRELERRGLDECGHPSFTCSVGAAFYPEDGAHFTELFQAADAAMYRAKRSGKNACALFDAPRQPE